jgi:YHS domain-containing protein
MEQGKPVMRFIIFAVLCYLLYRLIKGMFLSASKRPVGRDAAAGTTVVDEMVIDPVCRVYIPKREAITARSQGETVYFCSQECMKKYFQNTPENGPGTPA